MKRYFIIALALVLILGCAVAEKSLCVGGTGTIYADADTVYITLGVRYTGESPTELQRQANQTVDAICTALVDAGLEEDCISTADLYISPRYDYSEGNDELIGYSIEENLGIRSDDVEAAGEYIDAAFAAGANTFGGITFMLSDDTSARREALALAVKDASEKAQVIATASGEEIAGLRSISEGGSEANYYTSNSADGLVLAASKSASAGTQIRTMQVCVTAQVQTVYDLK